MDFKIEKRCCSLWRWRQMYTCIVDHELYWCLICCNSHFYVVAQYHEKNSVINATFCIFYIHAYPAALVHQCKNNWSSASSSRVYDRSRNPLWKPAVISLDRSAVAAFIYVYYKLILPQDPQHSAWIYTLQISQICGVWSQGSWASSFIAIFQIPCDEVLNFCWIPDLIELAFKLIFKPQEW